MMEMGDSHVLQNDMAKQSFIYFYIVCNVVFVLLLVYCNFFPHSNYFARDQHTGMDNHSYNFGIYIIFRYDFNDSVKLSICYDARERRCLHGR